MTTAVLWFRRDLRLADNPALHAALETGRVIPVYIHAPEEEGHSAPGAASRWWLHHSLAALDKSLQALGSRLVIRRGPALAALQTLVAETGATAVFWNRLYDPDLIRRDSAVKAALREAGLTVKSFNSRLWHEPWQIANKTGDPYKVFTPFWKACLAAGLDSTPLPPPPSLPQVTTTITSLPLADLQLLPKINWDHSMRQVWTPGEAGAWQRLNAFCEHIDAYHNRRNRLDQAGSSKLSPHLVFGEISPRQIYAHLLASYPHPLDQRGSEHFLRELGWREFAYHLIWHFPQLTEQPLDQRFKHMAWRDAPEDLHAWQHGRTGIPIVDAAMRELWATGWMHNRARMIVASLLTKNLLLDWRAGAAWFWDTLVDADLANNIAGWQWTAGCGADAAPYFRIFNPILQAEKFDPKGAYIRHWLPELAKLQGKALYAPWEADPARLQAAGILLGKDYPKPIVDLKTSRERALAAFSKVRPYER